MPSLNPESCKSTRESQIESYLVDQTKAAGGEVRKVQWIGRNGAPDRIVMLPAQPVIWVELKAPGKVCKPHQTREHIRMRAMGQRVEVVDSFDGVDALLKGDALSASPETIEREARAAVAAKQTVNEACPYPFGTTEAMLFQRSYQLAALERIIELERSLHA